VVKNGVVERMVSLLLCCSELEFIVAQEPTQEKFEYKDNRLWIIISFFYGKRILK
jgi:hypothetical protein